MSEPACCTMHYLGPEGTFTHQAAMKVVETLRRTPLFHTAWQADMPNAGIPQGDVPSRADAPQGGDGDMRLVAEPDVPAILHAVGDRREWGVIAWENNVEGYVVPNLDALIDAANIAGVLRVGVDIAFDAFVRPGHGELTRAAAHPHGLAQCRGFVRGRGLEPMPCSSNAAACRGLDMHSVALGPHICGRLYHLDTVAESVQDYQGARTDFLLLAPRDEAAGSFHPRAGLSPSGAYESIIAFIPLDTGPGVLANLLDMLRDAGLNMTSFISRPIKGHDGTYSFIATIDAAPWQRSLHDALAKVCARGDWVKTLAVYPRGERPAPPVDAWMLPEGGVCLASDRRRTDGEHGGALAMLDTATMEKELLW